MCTLFRCSARNECEKSDVTGHWLQESYGSPGSGCVLPTMEETMISLQKHADDTAFQVILPDYKNDSYLSLLI